MNGQTPMDAAATEAFEEAGLRGEIGLRPIGVFSYYKVHFKNDLPCIAVVYPLKVIKTLRTWPEQKERDRRWLSRKKAAALVDNVELSQIILQFKPDTA